MKYVLFNNELADATQPMLHLQNRSFLYGDGLFETMYWNQKTVRFAEEHTDRLIRSMQFFGYDVPACIRAEWLNENCEKVAVKNKITAPVRMKLMVFRQGNPSYIPDNPQPHFIFSAHPIPESGYLPIEKLGLFDAERKPPGRLSNFKTTSSVLFVLAGLHCRLHHFDDVILLNTNGMITDTIANNVFIIKENHILTPCLADGCLDGIMRRQLIKAAGACGIPIQQRSIRPEELNDCQEIFISNAIYGIRPVKSFLNRKLSVVQFLKIQECMKDIGL